MHMAAETAVIIWDDEAKLQHFIRKATFEGKAKNFGFIFPSPTQPSRIEVSNEELFGYLESFEPVPRSFGCSGADAVASEAKAGGVEVLEQKRVGDYEATVLRSVSGREIADWLRANGHNMRPAMVPWFDHYVKKGWVFTALKYVARATETPTKAVAISFKTDRPFYPYKMPSDTFGQDHHRKLDLFFIGRTPVDGRHADGSAWPTNAKWHSPKLSDYGSGRIAALATDKGATAIKLKPGFVVTRFENSEDATNYGQDLEFFPAGNASTDITVAVAGTGLIAFLLLRARKR